MFKQHCCNKSGKNEATRQADVPQQQQEGLQLGDCSGNRNECRSFLGKGLARVCSELREPRSAMLAQDLDIFSSLREQINALIWARHFGCYKRISESLNDSNIMILAQPFNTLFSVDASINDLIIGLFASWPESESELKPENINVWHMAMTACHACVCRSAT